jgi:hypothetical protein
MQAGRNGDDRRTLCARGSARAGERFARHAVSPAVGVTRFPRGDGPRGLADRLVITPASSEELPARSAADVRGSATQTPAEGPLERADYEMKAAKPCSCERTKFSGSRTVRNSDCSAVAD